MSGEFNPSLNPDAAWDAALLTRLITNANGGFPFSLVSASSTALADTHRGTELIFTHATPALTIGTGLTVGTVATLSPDNNLTVTVDSGVTVNGAAGGGTFTVTGGFGSAQVRVRATNSITLKGAVA